MKNTITNLIVVAALSISGTAFAAEEMGSRQQPAATQPAAAASTVPPATVVESTTAAPAEEPQPTTERSTSGKRAARTVRPKDLDLRHCLELDNNPAIARCARE